MKAADKCRLLLYAAKSALLVSGKYISGLERILCMEHAVVREMLHENKPSLHLGKAINLSFWI